MERNLDLQGDYSVLLTAICFQVLCNWAKNDALNQETEHL